MKMTARIDGIDQLMRKLDRLPEAVGRKIERQVLMAAGEIVADRAKQLVPVDSGNLRDSIAVSETYRGGNGQGITLGADSDLTVYIGPQRGGAHDGYYGHMVEFGTMSMAANPFMRPAWDSTKAEVQTRIARDLGAAIMRAAKG